MSRFGVVIIVIAVLGMMIGMAGKVMEFQDNSTIKKIEHQVTLDSLTAVRFEEALQNDSMMLLQIESQKAEIEVLKSQLNNIKYKLSVLADINSNQ
jgi:uncharacterized membrane protein